MKIRVVEKRKAIVLNEENKILVFLKEGDFSHLVYPTITEKNEDKLSFLSDAYLDYYEYLLTTKEEKTRYDVVNGHAEKRLKRYRKYYYAIMHELTESEKEELMLMSRSGGFYPDFLSIDEIKTYFENKYYSKNGLTDYIDKKIEPIWEIEKRLKRTMK